MMKKTKDFKLAIYEGSRAFRQRSLGRLAAFLTAKGVTANSVTFFRAALMLPLLFIVGGWPLYGVLLLILNHLLDGLDGVLARHQHTESRKGRILDVGTDNFFAVPVVLGLILANQSDAFWSALYLVNLLIHYFVNYQLHGIEIGQYPFSFSKYFVYAAMLIMGMAGINFYDPVLLFWSVFLLVENFYNIFLLYRR